MERFRAALARETRKGNLERGLEKTRQWEALFKHRTENRMYHHLKTYDRWKEGEAADEPERPKAVVDAKSSFRSMAALSKTKMAGGASPQQQREKALRKKI